MLDIGASDGSGVGQALLTGRGTLPEHARRSPRLSKGVLAWCQTEARLVPVAAGSMLCRFRAWQQARQRTSPASRFPSYVLAALRSWGSARLPTLGYGAACPGNP
jgi:hypothetical protein